MAFECDFDFLSPEQNEKFAAFGLFVQTVDGHDFDAIDAAVKRAEQEKGRPSAIILKTVKGKGVDFMENNVVYHYASGDSALCEKAKASIMRG